jgi:hypothetical protein
MAPTSSSLPGLLTRSARRPKGDDRGVEPGVSRRVTAPRASTVGWTPAGGARPLSPPAPGGGDSAPRARRCPERTRRSLCVVIRTPGPQTGIAQPIMRPPPADEHGWWSPPSHPRHEGRVERRCGPSATIERMPAGLLRPARHPSKTPAVGPRRGSGRPHLRRPWGNRPATRPATRDCGSRTLPYITRRSLMSSAMCWKMALRSFAVGA